MRPLLQAEPTKRDRKEPPECRTQARPTPKYAQPPQPPQPFQPTNYPPRGEPSSATPPQNMGSDAKHALDPPPLRLPRAAPTPPAAPPVSTFLLAPCSPPPGRAPPAAPAGCPRPPARRPCTPYSRTALSTSWLVLTATAGDDADCMAMPCHPGNSPGLPPHAAVSPTTLDLNLDAPTVSPPEPLRWRAVPTGLPPPGSPSVRGAGPALEGGRGGAPPPPPPPPLVSRLSCMPLCSFLHACVRA